MPLDNLNEQASEEVTSCKGVIDVATKMKVVVEEARVALSEAQYVQSQQANKPASQQANKPTRSDDTTNLTKGKNAVE